ncbi:MAG: type 1 glutamine amidotransferase domain-containing protein [Methylocapsa sp.]|nr:type 1 glutamine amidotransferase domain-containing protein [Methylocapsa sp.]
MRPTLPARKAAKHPSIRPAKQRATPSIKKYLEDREFREKITHTLKPGQIFARDYAGIFLPGSHGQMYDLAQDRRVAGITRALYENGGLVAAVCHWSAALLPVELSNGEHLLAGKTVAGFTNLEELLVGRKRYMPFLLEDRLKSFANYTKGLPFLPHVAVDGRLITGQNSGSAKKVAEAVVRALGTA